MSWSRAIEIAGSEAVFAVLFIGFLWVVIGYVKKVLDDNKKESQAREQYIFDMHEKQMDNMQDMMEQQRRSHEKREEAIQRHLDKNTEQLSAIAETMNIIQKEVSRVESKVDTNFVTVWKELGGKRDKTNTGG